MKYLNRVRAEKGGGVPTNGRAAIARTMGFIIPRKCGLDVMLALSTPGLVLHKFKFIVWGWVRFHGRLGIEHI